MPGPEFKPRAGREEEKKERKKESEQKRLWT
jgi:hypothetical protein